MRRTVTVYLAAWPLMAILGVLNGMLRVYGYGPHMNELAAHQLSTLLAVLVFGVFIWFLTGYRPPSSEKQALQFGLVWLGLTVLFEFGFGHWVAGHSWERLFHDYDLSAGRVWTAVLVWTAAAPLVFFKVRQRRRD